MSFLKVEENRYINIDRIGDIAYTPANSLAVVFVPEGQSPPNPSWLIIDLKSGEQIRLEGEAADRVWAAFQSVVQPPPRTDGETKPAQE
jgi:hypothetical protein